MTPRLLASAAALALAPAALAPQTPTATIYRDAYGAPHVFSATDAGAVYGMARVLADDDWRLIEENYIRALGRAAELDGVEAVPDDWMARALEIRRLSRQEYDRATPRMRGLLDAFAAGLNAYIADHPGASRLLDRVEPWYPLALIRFKYYQLEFLGYAGLRGAWTARLLRDGWPVDGTPAGPALSEATLRRPRFADAQAGPRGNRPLGSNEWAVAPFRTASGHALLLINPHQRFVGVQRYAEIHIHSDQGLVFSGLTVFGFLLPYMGHNDRLGWAYTDNYADRGDLYAETFDRAGAPLSYRYGDEHRTATTWTETIRVRTGTGVEDRTYRFWKTHHGPVVGVDDDGRPLAAKLARLERGGWFDQWDAMIRARSLDAWKEALSMLNVAYMNTMYADADGNIGYIYNSAVPRRDISIDWSGIVDGSDPDTEWRGFHSLDELPQVFNPPSGWLLNTNSSPFAATEHVPYTRDDFPIYMIGGETDNPRAVSSRRVLESLHDITLDSFARAVWDTRLSVADSLVPVISEEWMRLTAAPGGAVPAALRVGTPGRAMVADAVDRIEGWDRRADTLSVATTWFVLATERWTLNRRAGDRDAWPWSRALLEALELLEERWGRHDIAWGTINRHQRPLPGAPVTLDPSRPSLAVGGAPGGLGSVFSFGTAPFGVAGPRLGVHGNSFVEVVEFGPTVRARSVLNYGQSGDPASPHFFDQAGLYAARSFKDAWFSRSEVAAHAVSIERVQR